MNTALWIRRFEENQLNRPEPDWQAPISLDHKNLPAIRSSLEQFELGDGGGPASLIARDARRFSESSAGMSALVNLWFAEEREHSRLLGCAVERVRGKRIEGHWSFTAFCQTRRILGVRFELQVLLLTEIVSAVYYRMLRRYIGDGPIQEMCSLILRDETGHIAFHRARLVSETKRGEVVPSPFWRLQFRICGYAAAAMLWVNHRKCLESIGCARAVYFAEVGSGLGAFLRRLQRDLHRPQPVRIQRPQAAFP